MIPPRDVRYSAPAGAAECSHGWRAGRRSGRSGTRGTVDVRYSAPAGAAEDAVCSASRELHSDARFLRPSGAGTFARADHGFRSLRRPSPVATLRRPYRGEDALPCDSRHDVNVSGGQRRDAGSRSDRCASRRCRCCRNSDPRVVMARRRVRFRSAAIDAPPHGLSRRCPHPPARHPRRAPSPVRSYAPGRSSRRGRSVRRRGARRARPRRRETACP